MAVSVADLAKYYADTPPPKYDTLADLEARLEELRAPGYRSPFKFDASRGVGPFGTTGYGTIGTYGSVAEFLKATVPHVSSLYPMPRAGGFAADLPTPLWKQLSEKRGTSPWSINLGKFPYDRENPFEGALETLRPQLEKFALYMQSAAPGLQKLQRTLEVLRTRQPFLYDALDAWEAFLAGDIEALDRFIVSHLNRRPDDRTRLAVQGRLERAFGAEGGQTPEWASDPGGFDVGVFRNLQQQVRAEEKAWIDEIERLREAGVDRVSVHPEWGLRLRKALAQELELDHKAPWIDKRLKDHYVRERFPGAVLVARDEKPHLPEVPSRKREESLRSYTATVVAREAGEGLIKEQVVGQPLKTNKHDDLVVPFDPKEDRRNPPRITTTLSEDAHIERFEAQERERGRLNQLHETMRRAGLSTQEEHVMRLKWFEELGNKEIAARLGKSASQVGVEAWRGLKKLKAAARG